ncbi:MAG: twin-arginine translocase TatA/TatE family subunit [Lentisphaerae bacterium]|nr:twin-arginine translocase TatA/TatE family subunit [Lentisphaerota bacterium]
MPPCLGFLTGSPGPGELLILFLVVLVLFGPRRLPRLARDIGRLLAELRRSSQDFHRQIMDLDRPPPVDVVEDEDPAGRGKDRTAAPDRAEEDPYGTSATESHDA